MTDDARLWDDWIEHYKRLGLDEHICPDGIVDEIAYPLARHKLLFVLSETNGTVEELRTSLQSTLEKQEWWTIARWAAGIQLGFPSFSSLLKYDLLKALLGTACINLKKTPCKVSSNMTEIGIYAFRDRLLLKRQIKAIKPEFIIACGTIEILLWLLEAEKDKTDTLVEPLHCDKYNAVIIPMCHPAKRANNNQTYLHLKNLFDQIPGYERQSHSR